MEDGQKEDWAGFATYLREIGYAPMTLDLRGHGESTGELDWSSMPDDVLMAWNALTAQSEVDPTTSAIVGAGVGADLALVTTAAEPDVFALILLSPSIDVFDLQTDEAMVAYGERPVLIVASEDDPFSAEASLALAELAQGSQALSFYSEAGRGTDMFAQQPDLTSLILGWLRSQLGSDSPN
jgi:alpha-beta hydrolase superfamily lysophospholipase